MRDPVRRTTRMIRPQSPTPTEKAARGMCEQIPLAELANTLLRTPSGFDMFWCVLWIMRANPAIGLRLSRSLEPLMLQFQMSEACADEAVRRQPVASVLQQINRANADRLCRHDALIQHGLGQHFFQLALIYSTRTGTN